jgi:pentapeptide MXKDX repeat protein
LKRTTLIASALCFALGAFSAFAEDKMQHDSMGKPETHDKMDKMAKKDKMAEHDKMEKMDKMEEPGAAQ